MLKISLLFIFTLWFIKSVVDALEYWRVSKLDKNGLGLASGTDKGLEFDLNGKSKGTARPIVRV
ncbi:MAG: hypothetical protein Q9M36_13035 [Sulfurovum sp.]|nr:hypothetical protein [Sulfurovum sp.]